MKIFVCHAREERDLAEAVALKLRQNGHDPFLARRDLQPGAAYDREIRRAVAAADRALVLVSKASMTPGRYTLSEVEMFAHRWADPTGRVVAFRVEDSTPHPTPPYLGNVTIGEVRGDPATDIVTQTLAALEGGGPEDPKPPERRGCLSFALSLGPLRIAISLSCLALLGGYGLWRGMGGEPDPTTTAVAFDVVLTGVHFRDSPTSAVRNAARTIEWRIDEPAFFTLDRSGRPDRRALHLPTATAVRSFQPKATGEPLSFPLDVRIPVTLAPGQTSTVVDVPFTLGVDGQSGVAGARPLRVRVERDPSGGWTAAYLDGPEVRGGGADAPWTATLDLAVRANGAEVARPVAAPR